MAKGFKTGGRKKGTPNKHPNPLKRSLREVSMTYFEPHPQIDADGQPRKIYGTNADGSFGVLFTLEDADGKPLVISDFDADMLAMKPAERVQAQIRLLEFHTPKMKAIDATLDATVKTAPIEDLLIRLSEEEDEEEDVE